MDEAWQIEGNVQIQNILEIAIQSISRILDELCPTDTMEDNNTLESNQDKITFTQSETRLHDVVGNSTAVTAIWEW